MVKIGNSLEELLGLIKKDETAKEQVDSSNKNRNPCPEPHGTFEFTTSVLHQFYFLQQISSQMLPDSGGFVFYLFGHSGVIEEIIIPEQPYLENTHYLRESDVLSPFQSVKAKFQDKEFYGWGIYTYKEYSIDDSNFDTVHSALIKFSSRKVRQGNHDYTQLSFVHLMHSNDIIDISKENLQFASVFRSFPYIKGFILSEYPCGNIQIKIGEFKEIIENSDINSVKQRVIDEITKKIKVKSKNFEDRKIKYKIDASIPNKIDSFASFNEKLIKEKAKLSKDDTKMILNEFIKYIIENKTQNKIKRSTTTKGGDFDIYI